MILEHTLGKLTVQPDGKGLWSKKVAPVDLELVIRLEANTVEFVNGVLDYAHCELRAYYRAGWSAETDGDLYTDKATKVQVNAWLAKNGFQGQVHWSEQGMQDDDFAHFDVDYALLPQVFPQVFEKNS